MTSDIDFGKKFEMLRDILHIQLSCLNIEGLYKISEMLTIKKTGLSSTQGCINWANNENAFMRKGRV